MTELLSAAQMRCIEQAAIDSGAVSGLELMERAGQGVVEAIFAQWPELAEPRGSNPAPVTQSEPTSLEQSDTAGRALVLCGPGNNGGDGFVVARLLRDLGWAVEVAFYGTEEKLPPDARANHARWLALGGQITARGDDASTLAELLGGASAQVDLMVDALFGTGLSRPLADRFTVSAEDQGRLQRSGVRIVAVDVPSGLCADSGRRLGPVAGSVTDTGSEAGRVTGHVTELSSRTLLAAELTVTFHSLKQGHVLAEGPALCGHVVVHDIGLSPAVLPGSLSHRALAAFHSEQGVARHLCMQAQSLARSLSKQSDGHKFSHGHALVLTGGFGKTGAARLAARAALRGGAGLVTLGVPPAAQMEVACQITALMMTRVGGSADLSTVLGDARINALCLGPGLGQDRARDLLPAALGDPARAVVLDADALSAFAEDPEALFARLHDACVLTPHGGEFARLFPDLAETLAAAPSQGPAYSKVDATRAAAARAGCTVLFKGSDTVIAAPDGRCVVNAASGGRLAPWLATAGSGDVLAGLITGLLARGFAPFDAAETAAWLHLEAALSHGPGLIAEDLPEQVPQVLRQLAL
ncbi:NAD(P)H-hydrate dehydratase [Phaeobacter sp.]|uniref:NAD(P)H-hydrate dehydratase n=1 Tax=Phaeobacter sp. TaxID=1902409 RepID=UPI0025E0DFBB|nr:NAD(P)H-hydrate dehydratase [Phaeobacter sp.]